MAQKSLWELKKGDRYWGVYGFADYFQKRYLAVFAELSDAETYALHPDFEAGPNGLYVGPMRRRG